MDPDGLVERYEFLLPAPDHEVLPYLDQPVDERVVLLAVDDGIGTRVVWTGLPCQISPSVEVTRDEELLLVAVDRGPQVLAAGEACDSSEDFFVVELTWADGVAADSVEARSR